MPTGEIIAFLIFALFVSGVYLLEAVLLIRFAVARLKHRSKANILFKKPALILHLIALVGMCCLLYGYFIEPYRIEVTKIEIRTEKLKDTTFRIVHI